MMARLHIHHPAVTSTMEIAATLAAGGAPHGTVVTADHQTAGRGRHGRAWNDVPGHSLLASWVLRLPSQPEAPGMLSPLVALAVARSVVALAPEATVSVKWPNDVLIDGRKVAGILLASRDERGGPRVIAGTGINVRDPGIPDVTSLDAWTAAISVGEVLTTLAKNLDVLWPEFAAFDMTDDLHAELQHLLAWRGERVSVIVPDGAIEGVVTGLARDGALLLLEDGATDPTPVHAGEMVRGPRVIGESAGDAAAMG